MKKAVNWYAEAIKAITAPNVDFRELCINIAIDHPKAIVVAAQGPKRYAKGSLQERCKTLWDSGQKIHAIRLWREETGSGLKEAKDAVEAL